MSWSPSVVFPANQWRFNANTQAWTPQLFPITTASTDLRISQLQSIHSQTSESHSATKTNISHGHRAEDTYFFFFMAFMAFFMGAAFLAFMAFWKESERQR